MLNIIHLFRDSVPSSELYLWVEAPTARYYAARYPHQLDETALRQFNQSRFSNHHFIYDEHVVSLPCDGDGVPVPSLWIADFVATDDRIMTQYLPWTLCVARVKEPQAFLLELNVQKNYFEENVRLACDAQYWIVAGLQRETLTSIMPYSACLNEADVPKSVDKQTIQSFWG